MYIIYPNQESIRIATEPLLRRAPSDQSFRKATSCSENVMISKVSKCFADTRHGDSFLPLYVRFRTPRCLLLWPKLRPLEDRASSSAGKMVWTTERLCGLAGGWGLPAFHLCPFRLYVARLTSQADASRSSSGSFSITNVSSRSRVWLSMPTD